MIEGKYLLALTAVAFLACVPIAHSESAAGAYEGYLHHSFASAQIGDELFVFGGFLAKSKGPLKILTTNYRLNPASGQLNNINAPYLFGSGVAAAVESGKVFVSGGMGSSYRDVGKGRYSTSYSDVFAAYDIAANSWEELPAMPRKIAAHCSFADAGIVYVVGGTTETKKGIKKVYAVENVILRYSISTKSWSSLETPPNVLAASAACAKLGDEFFIVGGSSNGLPRATAWAWNFKANSWRALPDLPNPVLEASATALDGAMLVHGGWAYTTPRTTRNEVLRLQPRDTEWQVVGRAASGRYGHAMTSVGADLWLVGGGDDGSIQTPNSYTPHGLWLEKVSVAAH